jgi:transcriptional regulator with XRE-family HTH domain
MAKILSAWRIEHELPLRKLAKDMGVEYNVLWRFERGKEIESKHLIKIMWWLFDDKAA